MTIIPENLASFQRYQLEFTQHLRNPSTQARPLGVQKKRMAVYQEIVFNNLLQSVSACFPVAKQILGQRKWLKLVRYFFQEYSANTPYFKEIPAEFLNFLTQFKSKDALELPDFLLNLAHYEWIELALSSKTTAHSNQNKLQKTLVAADLLNYQVAFIQPLELLVYDYPVHKISKKFQVKSQENTQLLVYRNAEFSIKFVELNSITYQLLYLLHHEKMTGKAALTEIANALQYQNVDEIISFGLAILNDFLESGVITGFFRV